MARNEWWTERVAKAQAALESEDSDAANLTLKEMRKSLRHNSDSRAGSPESAQIEELNRILTNIADGRWARARERFAKLEPGL